MPKMKRRGRRFYGGRHRLVKRVRRGRRTYIRTLAAQRAHRRRGDLAAFWRGRPRLARQR